MHKNSHYSFEFTVRFADQISWLKCFILLHQLLNQCQFTIKFILKRDLILSIKYVLIICVCLLSIHPTKRVLGANANPIPEYKVADIQKSRFILLHYGAFKAGWDLFATSLWALL